MKISILFIPTDLWIGVFLAPHATYICIIPCFPIRIFKDFK